MVRIAVLLSLSLVLPCRAEPEIKGTPSELLQYLKENPREVAIEGKAQRKLEADKATVSLNVKTENKSLEKALRDNQAVRTRLAAKLKAIGIAEKDVVMSKFSSTPRYGVFADKAKSYTVNNRLSVVIRNESHYQKVAGLIDSTQELQYQGISFDAENKEKIEDSLVYKAYDNALEKARAYEGRLNIKLVPVSFSEIHDGPPVYAKAQMLRAEAYVDASGAAPAEEPVSQFDELVLTKRIVVEFRVLAGSAGR